MKNSVFKITGFALLLGAVVTLSSCEKEEIHPSKGNQVPVKELSVQDKDGGGDEEDPIIIYGVTQNVSSTPVNNAEVIIFDATTSTALDTTYSDSQGGFQFTENSGDYYFKVTASGYQVLVSNTYDFPDHNPLTLTLEE